MHNFKVKIPSGVSGDWSVTQFTVSPEESKFDAMRGMFHGGRYVPAGTYTALKRGTVTVMSDTPDELRDLWELQRNAKQGRVFIVGLGLGCAVQLVLERAEVELVTVVEKSPDVIKLVSPALLAGYGKRLEIIEGDGLTYKIPKDVRYNAAWYDIWDYICGDNQEEMTKFKRRFGRRMDWHGCWCEYQVKRANQQSRREDAMYSMFRR